MKIKKAQNSMSTGLIHYLLFLVFIFIYELVGCDPRHHFAQLGASLLDWMSSIVATISSHGRIVVRTFRDEHLGVLTVLNALQSIAHSLTGFIPFLFTIFKKIPEFERRDFFET